MATNSGERSCTSASRICRQKDASGRVDILGNVVARPRNVVYSKYALGLSLASKLSTGTPEDDFMRPLPYLISPGLEAIYAPAEFGKASSY